MDENAGKLDERLIFALYLLETFGDAQDDAKDGAICTIHELIQSVWIALRGNELKPLTKDTEILWATHRALSAIDEAKYSSRQRGKSPE